MLDEFTAHFAYQAEQLGTGHAVSCAVPQIPANCHDVIVLCGDVPLITPGTIQALITDHVQNQRHISVLGVDVNDPTGYGRILIDEDHQVCGIVEESDARPDQKQISTINTGIYCINKEYLIESLPKLKADNMQGEYYLTDIVAVGRRDHKTVGAMLAQNSDEFYGVNDKTDLLNVETLLEVRQRNKP